MLEKRIEIRWRDVDAYGHVNNAVYLNYLEEARDAWVQAVLGAVTGSTWDFVLARVEIDFRAELTQDDGAVIVRCAPSTTSWAVIDVRPVAESLRSSWLSSTKRGAAGRYSLRNCSHITTGEISVPESSVMCWIVFENSICSLRGSSNPCSVFIM